jgi:hypothetical protein
MAAAVPVIPKPEKGEVVTDEVLSTLQFSTLAQAIAFAGQSNPSTIWREMILDSQRAYAYYRELEEKDDDVGGAIEEMKLSVTRRATQLTAPDSSSAAVEVRDFVQAQMDVFDMDAVIDTLLDAPFYGMALSEVIWNVSAAEVGIADVRDCPQELFTFGPMFQPQVGQLRFMRRASTSQAASWCPSRSSRSSATSRGRAIAADSRCCARCSGCRGSSARC